MDIPLRLLPLSIAKVECQQTILLQHGLTALKFVLRRLLAPLMLVNYGGIVLSLLAISDTARAQPFFPMSGTVNVLFEIVINHEGWDTMAPG